MFLVVVVFLNPFNDKDYIGDKLSIVDIKAKDANEKTYQIEIQIAIHDYLVAADFLLLSFII